MCACGDMWVIMAASPSCSSVKLKQLIMGLCWQLFVCDDSNNHTCEIWFQSEASGECVSSLT